MLSPNVRMSIDYNRGLWAPVRWAHVVWAVLAERFGPLAAWWAAAPRRHWTVPLTLGAVLFFLLHPWDLAIHTAAAEFEKSLKGDVRREWFAWQQFGQGLFLIVLAVTIGLLDPARRRRLADLALLALVQVLAVNILKMSIGRPRPGATLPDPPDPHTFLGPMGAYPLMRDGQWVLRTGWDGGSALWSMPSSHTMFAVATSVFIANLYPRLLWPCVLLAALVASGRVVFGAHWPTDVVVGAALGYALAAPIVRGRWASRLFGGGSAQDRARGV